MSKITALVLNSGSSSIKFQLFHHHDVMASGLAEKIGEGESFLHTTFTGQEKKTERLNLPDHRAGLENIVRTLIESNDSPLDNASSINAVVHRVVHGGEEFVGTTLIDGNVIKKIEQMIPLAPLHNPANLQGIVMAQEIFPHAHQVAVFDTAFHQSMPAHAYHYAIPRELYDEHKIRRYGFHGTSHRYVVHEAASFLNIPFTNFSAITCHLGNGASICAIKNGQSIDTSMGLTPLEGLIMGTRCGDIDPAIPYFLSEQGVPIEQVNKLLNKESGLKGISGSNDLREIEEKAAANDEKAKLAILMYSYRIKKYIGAYTAALGTVDALIFTAGVGENSDTIRAQCTANLEHLGILLDAKANQQRDKVTRLISQDKSPTKILVVPTNEELQMVREAIELIK